MRIAVLGGGPAGLYFALLAKQLNPGHEIEVFERNPEGETFGFGVVFSDETLGGIEHADREVHRRMEREFARWDDIDVHYRGQVVTSGGHGFAALSRHRLLAILRARAGELGVPVRYGSPAPPRDRLRNRDLVVAADGVGSPTRTAAAATFEPTVEAGSCRYMWLGTQHVFDAFTFAILDSEGGPLQVHAYPYSREMSTFIVEATEESWRRGGFDAEEGRDWRPGESDERSVERLTGLCTHLLKGAPLLANQSRWIQFLTVRNRRWCDGRTVLIGDAAHTAHFSIGSGTKLAMEDALALAACLGEQPTVEAALTAYEDERRPVVESTQRAAEASREWFERLPQYLDQEPLEFAFNLLTRSRRVTRDNLALRDPEFQDRVDRAFAAAQGHPVPPSERAPLPLLQPLRLRDVELPNRIVVSPMDMYSATEGLIGDFHLVHLGSKALGGAGLVMTEMVCVSPEGRISPGCAGLWNGAHEAALRRLVAFVHEHTPARIGLQLGHSGRKGSTRLMWEGMDLPLDEGNWPLFAASPLPYLPGVSQVPREMTESDLESVLEQFRAAATRGARAGFDLLELHAAHGYLLAGFLSPLTNRRHDRWGGSLENRLRYPLQVFDAMRAAWPSERPMTVRISATDWAPGGLTLEDAVCVARAFAAHGADAIHVSTGQTVPDEQPAFGRTYQVPFADAIRHRAGVRTIAVGAISSSDDVNSILIAGRADLCALGRGHLYDPAWTLHAAAE
ncbi:MAG: bifunctional salicylyl-CoA 5-hydroxylase/oxidoreductase, partial [Candidatus Dormibacteraeota bacterium]|nr:bifunctional salicylyl-CoA 5-hydroxylase/oxidoreductase [Candidatus Dormibacteraeota bacterium]